MNLDDEMNFEDEGNKKGKNKGKTNGNNNGNNNAGKKKEKMMMGDRDEKKNKRKGVGVEGMIGNAVEEESGQNKKQKSEPIRCRCHQNHQLSKEGNDNHQPINNTTHHGVNTNSSVDGTNVFCEICTPHQP